MSADIAIIGDFLMQLNHVLDTGFGDTGISGTKVSPFDTQVSALLARMQLDEKIGQLCQVSGCHGAVPEPMLWALREGRIGSVLNEADLNTVNELQRIAVEESRLGIPLLIGRDVIHGFKTIFPIPIAQASSWNPNVVSEGARISALEASTCGINWTFAPMIDICRDPRWGRIAESLGEDPYLCGQLGAAMIKGFQTDSLGNAGAIAACAKHFAGYGASESGRDYATVILSENELRNVHLRPFKDAADAGVATFMAAFSDLNGVPASGNTWLMDELLRDEWQYKGVVVSDWDSIGQLSVHGFTANDKEAAYEAATAGIDMEMVSTTYRDHLQALISEGRVSIEKLDLMVSRLLSLKYELGLFDNPYIELASLPKVLNERHLAAAKDAAIKSCVLLKNQNQTLPLTTTRIKSMAIIGPLADDAYEQLGTWIFDGEAKHSVTCLDAIKEAVNSSNTEVRYAKALETSRSRSTEGFAEAVNIARESDVAVLFLGEETILSGEAHSRANIDLPGSQEQLIEAIAETGVPIVLVILAGRPLTLEKIIPKVDAVLYAWHPGTMGGPAIADLLFGVESPSGKLPVSFPRVVGQIPIYYAQKNTGKPASDNTYVKMDDIAVRAPQTSLGMTAAHLDTHFTPLFEFGYGLSYSSFEYSNIGVSQHNLHLGESIEVHADLSNTGECSAEEIVQLYVRDLVGNVTRPVKELKGFQRVKLEPKQSTRVSFTLHTDELAFHDRKMQLITEPGHFHAWIGGSSSTELRIEFEILTEPKRTEPNN
ncbi:MAG: beta-glucosidase [Lentisphaeria bacterium]|jgi:beta-glucosidase